VGERQGENVDMERLVQKSKKKKKLLKTVGRNAGC
jgi:hypothetical protein